jgi:hypothetical protein
VCAVPSARWRRSEWGLGAVGAVLVIAAIPTNSKWIVLAGLLLVVLAHMLWFLSFVVRRKA